MPVQPISRLLSTVGLKMSNESVAFLFKIIIAVIALSISILLIKVIDRDLEESFHRKFQFAFWGTLGLVSAVYLCFVVVISWQLVISALALRAAS